MRTVQAGVIAISLVFASAAFPYVRSTVSPGGQALFRSDAGRVQYLVNLTRGSNVAGSDAEIMTALQGAANAWSSIPGTTIHFNPIQATTLIADSSDGHNVISFENNSTTGSVVNGALAVTFTFYSPSDGVLTDTDIVFNPKINFSTSPSANVTDLQSVATHEMGHALGASHSGVYGATMFYATGPGQTSQQKLSEDDQALMREAYPAAGGPQYGRITGHLLASGGGFLRGGLVAAVDSSTGVVVGGISLTTDGTYSFQVPAGNYVVYAEPIGGQLTPDVFSLSPIQISTNFQAGFYGGNSNPGSVAVSAGSTNTIDVSPPGGKSGLSVNFAAVNRASFYTSGPQVLPSGQSSELEIAGNGVDSLTEQDIRLVGPVSLRPGSLVQEGSLSGSPSYPLIRMTVDVPARTNVASASLFLSHGGSTTAFTGGLILTPARPAFPAGGVVNAFTFTGGNIAPGEDISIFGTTLGPLTPLVNTPDASGTYSTGLGGVTVTFDGQAAPLFYVSQGQINLQAPVELAGKTTTSVVVTYGLNPSDPIGVTVAPVAGGLYPSPVNNDDGMLNSAKPAKRGSYILIYGTGQGLVSPAVGTGKAAPAPSFAYAGATTVTFRGTGGQTVTPYFSGLAPGFVGLWQISVQVPTSLAVGTSQLFVTVNGVPTAPINVSVQ